MSSNAQEDASLTKAHVEETTCTLVYYAAERTLMAWIRTALGMMALGFVIDRFGLVLRMMPSAAGAHQHPTVYSFWTGTVLVLGGSLMAFVAAIRYTGLERRFRREDCGAPGHGLPLGVFFTLFVAFIGVAISIFLTAVR
jgi:putative membrane protein